MISSLVFAGVAFLIFLVVRDALEEFEYRRESKRRGCGLPPMLLDWPFGIVNFVRVAKKFNAFHLFDYFDELFARAPAKNPKTVREGRLFRKLLVTIEPENIKAVCATQFSEFDVGLRYYQLHPIFGDGIFTTSGEQWRHLRSILQPQFAREQVANLDMLEEHVSQFLAKMEKLSVDAQKDSSYFDVLPEFHNLTMDAATDFLYGESTNSINGPQYEVSNPGQTVSPGQFADSLKQTLTTITDRLQLGGLYWLVDNKKFRAHVKNCKDFSMYFVKKVLDDPRTFDSRDSRSIFVRELAKETRDPVVIRDQSINVMIAGMDTTASLLAYICYRLSRDRRVWQRLRTEVLDAFGRDPAAVSFEALKRCRYPHYVVNETLRLYPIVAANFRRAMRDTTLPRGGGPDGSEPVFVPKGTEVLFPVFNMQRDPDLWGSDARMFRPERWEENPIHTWDYLPFGGGPRICIGQQFALTETAFTLVRLVQHFDDILPSPEQPEYEPAHRIMLAASAADGVKVRFVPAA